MAESSRPCPSCATPVPLDAITCPSCGALSLPGPGEGAVEGIARRLGQALGRRYRLEREVGRGGMAVVFLAHDLRHDRPVALKVLLPELSRYLGLERFLREIHIAAQLNHPHILALHDSGEADGLLFYVMPYLEGDSLRRRLARAGPLPVDEAVRIAGEVADGLEYAHRHGVVHRDIKPENILLAEGHAVIADFGIARALAGAGADATITTTGIGLGTPQYMSPEQAAGDPSLDHRTDVYALGCMLFEMLAGRPPFEGPNAAAMAAQHLSDPAPSARAIRREVPASLDAAVRRAMAKSPDDRYQSAAELAAGLGAAEAPARTRGRHRPARAARWRLAAAAVAILIAGAGAGALLLRGRGASPPTAPATATLRVVVQPFADRTGVLGQTAARVTEAVTDLLLPVPALSVTAYAAVAELGDVSLDSLRSRFEADRVVVGRLDTTAAGLGVAVQIVDAASGRALADSEVTVPRGAAATTVAAAAGPLSVFVRHAFWEELDLAQRRARVRGATAWSLVERARNNADEAERAAWERFDRQSLRSLDVADSLLREAHERDPGSDLVPIEMAHVADARAMFAEYLLQMRLVPPKDLPSPTAERARALGLLDRLIRERRGPADAFELRGRLKEGLWRTGGADSLLDAAIADYRSATELDLHRATAWRYLASALLAAGRFSEALLTFDHASEEDVFQLYRPYLLRGRFDAAFQARRFEVAEQTCREGVAEVTGPEGAVLFGDCDLDLWSRTRGDFRTASLAQARLASEQPSDSGTLLLPLRELHVAEILARAGLGEESDHLAGRALSVLSPAWLPLLLPEAAYLRILRGDLDSATALVVTTARLSPVTKRYLRSAAWFQPLRDDPRFVAAVGGTLPTP
jgi:tetratricopeptide (TPR) repeat protein/TolB-like protein